MFPVWTKGSGGTTGGDNGFTLLELLVVLAIMSLVLMAVPAVYANIIPGYQVRQFANELANVGRTLREQSRELGSVTQISIDTEVHQITATGIKLDIPNGVFLSFEPPAVYGVGTPNAVLFYSSGTTSGGTIILSRKNIEVSVKFDWITGAIEVVQ